MEKFIILAIVLIFNIENELKHIGIAKWQKINQYCETRPCSRITEIIMIDGVGRKTVEKLLQIYPIRLKNMKRVPGNLKIKYE